MPSEPALVVGAPQRAIRARLRAKDAAQSRGVSGRLVCSAGSRGVGPLGVHRVPAAFGSAVAGDGPAAPARQGVMRVREAGDLSTLYLAGPGRSGVVWLGVGTGGDGGQRGRFV